MLLQNLKRRCRLLCFIHYLVKKKKNDIETYLQQKIMKMLTFITLRMLVEQE